MFTTEHFIWIAISLAFIVGMTVLSEKCRFSFKTAALIVAAIALASETAKIFTHMEFVNGVDASEGMVIEATALPFHLCSLLIFAYFYLPFARDGKFKSYLLSLSVPIALIGGTLAILMATSGTDFAAPYAYQCFLYHASIIWFSVYLIRTKQVDLGLRPWVVNMASLLALAILMIWVNGALQSFDTNFFYVVRPQVEGLPLLNLDNGWYWYFATVLGLGFVGVGLVHLPFILAQRHCGKTKG